MLTAAATGCTDGRRQPSPRPSLGTVTGFVGVGGGALQLRHSWLRPVPEAKIELTSSGHTTIAIAAKDGRYTVQVIPGHYTVSVIADPPCQTTSAVVTGGKVTTADVTCIMM